MTLTVSRSPVFFRALMMTSCCGTVVVSSADIPMIAGRISWIAAMTLSVGVSLPMSKTSNPDVFNMAPTMFLPRSCRSPLTVNMTTLMFVPPLPIAIRAGSTIALQCLKTSAEATTSGRKTSPRFQRSPSWNIATAMPSSRMPTGLMPISSISCAALVAISSTAS